MIQLSLDICPICNLIIATEVIKLQPYGMWINCAIIIIIIIIIEIQ
jgi:hypothetical protein